MSLLGKLVVDEIFLINTIIEKNSLSQNIELLKKLNLYRDFEKETMQKLIERISALRNERNLFIHALWGQPFVSDDKVLISCLEPRIVTKINKYGRMWSSGKEHTFELSFLVKKIEEIDSILKVQKELLDKLETHRF